MRNGDIEMRRLQRAAEAATVADAPMAHYLLGAERIRRQLCPRCGTPGVEVAIPTLTPGEVTAREHRTWRIVARLSTSRWRSSTLSSSEQERVGICTVKVMQALRPAANVLGCPASGCRWNTTHGWCDPSRVVVGAVGLFQSPTSRRGGRHVVDVMVLFLSGSPDREDTHAAMWPVAWVRGEPDPNGERWAFPELVDSGSPSLVSIREPNGSWVNRARSRFDLQYPAPKAGPVFVPTFLVPGPVEAMPDAIAHEEETA